MLSFLVARLREPSTYAGLGAILAGVGFHPSAPALGGIVNAAVGLAGLAAVLIPEAGKHKP